METENGRGKEIGSGVRRKKSDGRKERLRGGRKNVDVRKNGRNERKCGADKMKTRRGESVKGIARILPTKEVEADRSSVSIS